MILNNLGRNCDSNLFLAANFFEAQSSFQVQRISTVFTITGALIHGQDELINVFQHYWSDPY